MKHADKFPYILSALWGKSFSTNLIKKQMQNVLSIPETDR
jgi:hypothetical protein